MKHHEEEEVLLFPHLVRATPSGDQSGDHQSNEASISEDGARARITQWWNETPLWRADKNDDPGANRVAYTRMYRCLADACDLEVLTTAGSNRDSIVDQWIATDWAHDESMCWDSVSVIDSLTVICSKIAHRTPLEPLLANISNVAASDPTQPPVVTKKPTTMAEKLAQMRSKRSTFVNEKNTNTTNPDTSTASLEISLPFLSAASASSLSTVANSSSSAHSHDDNSSHFFSIETRLELKERLQAIQNRLEPLILQSKLAWMKCFASGIHTDANSDAVEQATRLVEDGETLTQHLMDALNRTRTSGGPINEFKALVATCETEFAAFEAFVHALAAAPSPVKPQGRTTDKDHTTDANNQLGRKPLALAFDLPSMKSYYERAAPSYAAYLPKKATAATTIPRR